MKKICIFALCLCLTAGLCACGTTQTENNPNITDTPSASTPLPSMDEPASDSSAVPLPVAAENPVLQDGKTYTGLPALPLQDFSVTDPENTKGLSTEKHGYSYGVSKDGQPHATSVANQKYFEEHGYKAFCLDTKSTEKVLYLTFDCGYENGYTSKILDTLKEKDVPAAFFCTLHPSFPTLTRIRMAEELQGMDNYLRTNFGYSEPFFRFPMGEYSDCALDLIGSLGYRSVFWSVAYADWDLDKQKGADYAFNTVTARLHPGAVILLHSVSPDNAEALGRIIDWARGEGYTFKSLRDFPNEQ